MSRSDAGTLGVAAVLLCGCQPSSAASEDSEARPPTVEEVIVQWEKKLQLPPSPGTFTVEQGDEFDGLGTEVAVLIGYRGPSIDGEFSRKIREYCGGPYTTKRTNVRILMAGSKEVGPPPRIRSAVFECWQSRAK
jgi:hypothetical protein